MGASGSESSNTSIAEALNRAWGQNNAASWQSGGSGSQQNSLGRGSTSSGSVGVVQLESFVDPRQQGYLDQLRGGAFGAAMPGQAQGAADQIGAMTQGGIGQGFDRLAALGDPRAQIAAQSGALQEGLGNLFRNEINPAIRSDAIAAGGFGGGRQGVAEGVAAGRLGEAYAQGLGDITARANQQALGANTALPGYVSAMLGNQGLQSGFGLSQYGQLADILGGPTVLQEAAASNRATSRGNTYSVSSGRATSRTAGGSRSSGRTASFGESSQRGESSDQRFGFNLF